MKRKWILRTVLVLIVVFIAAVVIIAFSMGAIVKKGIETIGPKATQTDVTLKSAGVWLIASRVELTGFVLGNPQGYTTTNAISVGDVSVRVKAGSVFSDKIVVDSISVKMPVITLEGGLRDNNLTKIENNLNTFIGSSSTSPNSSASSSSPAKPERKLQVNDLLISGAKLQVNTKLSGGRTITLSIPDIHLTALGSGPEGITAVEVAQRCLHAVLEQATIAIAKNAVSLGGQGASAAKDAARKAGGSSKT